jgi:hypothetical protein
MEGLSGYKGLPSLTEEVVRMAKAYCYCPECKKMLAQVLSSFECLSTWDKIEDCYMPGDDCKLVKRCPDCGTLAKERERKIHREEKSKTEKAPPADRLQPR